LLYAGTTSIFSFKYFILNDTVKKLKQWSKSTAGNIFNIKNGTSETLCNETSVVKTDENVKSISVHRGFERITVWLRTKLRGHLKALVTKVLEKTVRLALLMIRGIVKSLEIDLLRRKIGYRGSKSEFIFCKRATSRWFFSITSHWYCKVYSSRRETGYW
jgi:hypothetical protein